MSLACGEQRPGDRDGWVGAPSAQTLRFPLGQWTEKGSEQLLVGLQGPQGLCVPLAEGLALWELFPPLRGKCHFILSYRRGAGTLHPTMFC